ncbi:unnamed protein product [Citrullus colocynthis]|uniref:Protein FRA10AC1 n=1 Tax=Citrullus colocynthis TaxID=252529 RepID=A0ABP0XQN2_9ROSI
MASFGSLKNAIFEREERKQQYQAHLRGLNAYDRHKKFMHDYVHFYGKNKTGEERFPIKTDHDTLREGYRFIRSEEDDMDTSWEQKLVKRYYDKLFKEYCIADMTQYKSGKIGLRWRTEKEVISGKDAQGSFTTRERKKRRNRKGRSKKCPKGRGATQNFAWHFSDCRVLQKLTVIFTFRPSDDNSDSEGEESRTRRKGLTKCPLNNLENPLAMTLAVSLQERRPQHHLGILKLMAKKTLMNIWRACFHNNVDEYGPQGYTSCLHDYYFQRSAPLKPFQRLQMAVKLESLPCIVHAQPPIVHRHPRCHQPPLSNL